MERATGLTDEELIRAIEDNAAELLLRMGAAGGGVQRDDAAVRWTIGGSPIDYHNAVVAASLDDDSTDRVIAESLQELKNRGVPGSWHVGPSMRPLDLGERLLAAGFTHGGSEPGMAVRLSDLQPARAAARAAEVEAGAGGGAFGSGAAGAAAEGVGAGPELRVERVGSAEMLGVWVETLGRGFGEGPREAWWVGEVYGELGLTDPWRHYLGYLDDLPVATASVFLGAGVAGVYFVMTAPEVRRRGIGGAITHTALREARDSGFQYAVLGSSPAGRSVYARLGFRELCTIDLYEWALPQE
jgi:GNAT superfamily N-acetyltransferase